MNELLSVNKNLAMTSKDIAEITGKNHADVMRDIRNMIDELGESKNALSILTNTYKSVQNKDLPLYELDKKAVQLLVTGYSVVLRLKILDRLEQLEKSMSIEEMIIAQAQSVIELRKQAMQLEQRVTAIENSPVQNAEITHFSILGYCRNKGLQISMEQAKTFGLKCRAMCKEMGFVMGKVLDSRFGSVNTYPLDVLNSVIN